MRYEVVAAIANGTATYHVRQAADDAPEEFTYSSWKEARAFADSCKGITIITAIP